MPALSIVDYEKLEADNSIWIWKGIIPISGAVSLFGNPKLGKSLFSVGLCEAIADPTISSFMGLPIQQHGKVLIVQLDTPRGVWRTGYLSLIKSNVARNEIYIIDREMQDLPKGFDIRLPHCREWLRSEVDKICPILVVIDTIRRMHKGNENESDTMEAVHDAFIWATRPAALLYIGHKRKPQQGDSGPGSMRGSTGFTGAVDALLNMTKNMLYVEARSDAPEEIPIVQLDSGLWAPDSGQDEKLDYIRSLGPDMTEAQRTKAIMDQFGVTDRTARRYKKAIKDMSA